ncbi:hypothetical protein [Methylobacterium sp. Gmos1]
MGIGNYPLESVVRYLYLIISHEIESEYYTGVVIAGYGREELFPSISHHVFDGKCLGLTRTWRSNKCFDLNKKRNQDAAIIPFAQADIAQLFLEGIAPQYLRFLSKTFMQVLRGKTDKMIDDLVLDADERLVEKFIQSKEIKSMIEDFGKQFKEYRRKAFIKPILDTIRALPKEEMAYMARAMVEITALRRRFASAVESVGGEIDVAIISKSDGFVWINRKHYFDLDLNPDFLQRRAISGGGGNGIRKAQKHRIPRAQP